MMLKKITTIYCLKFVRKFNTNEAPKKTVLFNFHVANKGKMVNFGGYLLPVQYGTENISSSHIHTRKHCSLFDVSHMMQTEIYGQHRNMFLESLCTTDIEGMKQDSCALSLFTDSNSGGILDDLIITKCKDHLLIVSNASRREQDKKLLISKQDEMEQKCSDIEIKFFEPHQKSLLALQGPKSAAILQFLIETNLNFDEMPFMSTAKSSIAGIPIRINRCGYTGEDGFELSFDSKHANKLAQILSEEPDVKLAGLGARDTLRLEAGLCLYGNDIDKTTTPVSAMLMWTIDLRRRQAKDFPGATLILNEYKKGPRTKRVGLISTGRSPPARQGCLVHDLDGNLVGHITSGCPSPTLNANVAMAYVNSELTKTNTPLTATVRGFEVPVRVAKLPFIKPGYFKKK